MPVLIGVLLLTCTVPALLQHILSTECDSRWFPDLGESTGINRLVRWIDLLREEPRSEPEITGAFFVLIFESAGATPGLRSWTNAFLQRIGDAVIQSLGQAQEEGHLRVGVDIEAEAEMFASSGIGLALRWIVEDDLTRYDRGLLRLQQRFESFRSDA